MFFWVEICPVMKFTLIKRQTCSLLVKSISAIELCVTATEDEMFVHTPRRLKQHMR